MVIIFFIISASHVFAIPKVIDVMKKMESIMELATDFTAKVNITFTEVGQGTRISEFIYFRRDKTDEFLLIYTKPESEKGNGYLRTGDNFWMYRKNTRTFQHISRDENIGGSGYRTKVLGPGMTDRDGSVRAFLLLHKHVGNRLSHNVAASDYHHIRAFRGDVRVFEHLQNAVRRARKESRLAHHQSTKVHGVEPVDVLVWMDPKKHFVLIDVVGERELYQDTVDLLISVQFVYEF